MSKWHGIGKYKYIGEEGGGGGNQSYTITYLHQGIQNCRSCNGQ